MSEKMLLVLLAGQSNMAGRGAVEPEDAEIIPGLMMMNKKFEWVPAVDPITEDRPFHGVGPGRTFGKLLLERNPGCTVGLLPCAVGGSRICSWKPGQAGPAPETGEKPYDDALARVKAAAPAGVFEVILWHQGENDSDANYPENTTYESDLIEVMTNFRREMNSPDVPVICGELGKYLDKKRFYNTARIDAAMKSAVAKLGHAAWVQSEGLVDKGDRLHFDAASARELGRRYFEKYLELTSGNK